MCGIFGLIGTPWRDGVGAALDTLRTRGPDDSALLDLGDAILGHTRLAVIDLVSGQQPMRSADGRYTIVFNGEIYNFRELRKQLAGAGHAFITQSDTEVLLQGFAAWGERLVPRLDGMFAFAVWDARERVLFAARGRMGIKPFFYSTAAGFSFGSTLAPFLRLDGFPRRIDYQALRDYLASQTALAPHSFLNAVRQLSPASQLAWSARGGPPAENLQSPLSRGGLRRDALCACRRGAFRHGAPRSRCPAGRRRRLRRSHRRSGPTARRPGLRDDPCAFAAHPLVRHRRDQRRRGRRIVRRLCALPR